VKKVDEEIRWGNDILLLPMELLVCLNCGERYYDKKTMKKIEQIRARLEKKDLELKEIGKVFREQVA